MKKIDKETLVIMGTYTVGLVLVVTSCMRKGAYDVINSIEKNNLTVTDAEGFVVDLTLPSRNPFKK